MIIYSTHGHALANKRTERLIGRCLLPPNVSQCTRHNCTLQSKNSSTAQYRAGGQPRKRPWKGKFNCCQKNRSGRTKITKGQLLSILKMPKAQISLLLESPRFRFYWRAQVSAASEGPTLTVILHHSGKSKVFFPYDFRLLKYSFAQLLLVMSQPHSKWYTFFLAMNKPHCKRFRLLDGAKPKMLQLLTLLSPT